MTTSAGHRIIKAIHWYYGTSGHGGAPSLARRRAEMEKMARLLPRPWGTTSTEVDAGGVPSVWVTARNAAESEAVVLYLHGGGYNSGSPATHRGLTARISRSARARLLVPDYRLAPEHPFPAALEDAIAAYRWLLAEGVGSVVMGGDSAGGGLAVAAMVALRDAGDPLPVAAFLLSPWVDLAGTGETMVTKKDEDPWIDPAEMPSAAGAYLSGEDPTHPLASPLYADLGGLPPILIQVGTAEVLLDDSRRLATRLREAGGEVMVDEWPDQIHVFQAFAPFVPAARPAIGAIGRFVRTRTAG